MSTSSRILTQAEVWAAIDAVISQGERPTNAGLREFLGNRGSVTTINRMLTAWFEHYGPTLMASNLTTETEDEKHLREAVAGVLQLARKVANNELVTQREELEKAQAQHLREAEKIQNTLDTQTEQIKTLEQQLASQQALRASLENRVNALHQGEQVLTERCTQLEANLQHAQSEIGRLDAELATTKRERDAARQAVDESRQALEHARAAAAQAQAQAQALLHEHEKALAAAGAVNKDLDRQLANRQALVDSLSKQVEGLTQKMEAAHQKMEADQKGREQDKLELATVHGQNRELTKRLAEIEARHEKAVAQHEKALAEERDRVNRQIELLASKADSKPARKTQRR